ncbi:hypothetical protein QT397_02290 (plasmid) [Microbulbifer sp. MKSA007]|nr:hypothetical protein QT397_02290 [Microbulbifer sp. MKSA007]
MKYVNIVLQGKGGAGKSFVSLCLSEFLRHKERKLIAIDTDPVNPTLHSYKALNCNLIRMMDNGEIDHRSFDQIIEGILEAEEDLHFVIDTGATTFLPMLKYLDENGVLDLLQDNECEVAIHTVVSGEGQLMLLFPVSIRSSKYSQSRKLSSGRMNTQDLLQRTTNLSKI